MIRNKACAVILVLALAAGVLLVGCAQNGGNGNEGADETESKGTLTTVKTPYSYEWVALNILKPELEEIGYEIEVKNSDIGPMWLGLSQGDIDFTPDVWLPSLHKTYIEKYEGEFELLDTWLDDVPLGFAVPKYIENVNTVGDLKGKSEMFNGEIIGLEEGAGMMLTAREAIEAHGLDYELIPGSTPAMMAEAEKATRKEEPIIILGWRPHSMMKRFDLKVLEDEKDVWIFDDVYIGAASDLKERAPDAYRFLDNFHISIDDVEAILYGMSFDEEGNKRDIQPEEEEELLKQLTKEWREENSDKIEQWKQD